MANGASRKNRQAVIAMKFKTIKRVATEALLMTGVLALAGAPILPAAQTQSRQGKGNKSVIVRPRPQVVINDIQISQIGSASYLLRVQSNGPLAFDRLKSKNANQIIVQFHQARLGALPNFDSPAFGSVSLHANAGNVQLTIKLASTSYRVVVSQGGNPNVVELRIRG